MRYINILLLMLVSTSIKAQLDKGTKTLGGDLSASYSTYRYDNGPVILDEDRNTSRFSIMPEIGFFLKDNLSLVFGIGYAHSVLKSERTITNSQLNIKDRLVSNTFNLSVASRLHKPISDRFYAFLEPSVNLGLGSSRAEIETDQKLHTFSLGISPGMLFMLNDNFAIDSSFGFLGYTLRNNKPTSDSERTSETVNKYLGLDISSNTLELGLKYYF